MERSHRAIGSVAKSGSEQDWIYGRRWYHFNARIGAWIKTQMNRRARRAARREANPDAWDDVMYTAYDR